MVVVTNMVSAYAITAQIFVSGFGGDLYTYIQMLNNLQCDPHFCSLIIAKNLLNKKITITYITRLKKLVIIIYIEDDHNP